MQVKYVKKTGQQYNESYEYLEPHCGRCGLNLSFGVERDGSIIDPIFCPYCGTKIDKEADGQYRFIGTEKDLIDLGFEYSFTFNRWEKLCGYGYLNYTVIENRIIKQYVSTSDFNGYTEENPTLYIQDLIKKGLVKIE